MTTRLPADGKASVSRKRDQKGVLDFHPEPKSFQKAVLLGTIPDLWPAMLASAVQGNWYTTLGGGGPHGREKRMEMAWMVVTGGGPDSGQRHVPWPADWVALVTGAEGDMVNSTCSIIATTGCSTLCIVNLQVVAKRPKVWLAFGSPVRNPFGVLE